MLNEYFNCKLPFSIAFCMFTREYPDSWLYQTSALKHLLYDPTKITNLYGLRYIRMFLLQLGRHQSTWILHSKGQLKHDGIEPGGEFLVETEHYYNVGSQNS